MDGHRFAVRRSTADRQSRPDGHPGSRADIRYAASRHRGRLRANGDPHRIAIAISPREVVSATADEARTRSRRPSASASPPSGLAGVSSPHRRRLESGTLARRSGVRGVANLRRQWARSGDIAVMRGLPAGRVPRRPWYALDEAVTAAERSVRDDGAPTKDMPSQTCQLWTRSPPDVRTHVRSNVSTRRAFGSHATSPPRPPSSHAGTNSVPICARVSDRDRGGVGPECHWSQPTLARD